MKAVLLLLISIKIISIEVYTYRCQRPCYCHNNVATCNSRRLRYIPKLPSYITIAKFVGNNFTTIDRRFFSNLTQSRITILNLTDNLIHDIMNDAFTDFRNLVSFEVSREPKLNISKLKESFYSLPKTVSFVQLAGNGWITIPDDMFTPFTNNTALSFNVSVPRNKLQNLNGKVFNPLKKLRLLKLSQNSIKNVDVEGLSTVQELDLSVNYIRDIPNWCGQDNKTLVPNLLQLRLADNSIAEMDRFSFRCLGHLQTLGLDANNFRTLQSDTFLELRSLQKLYISDNARIQHMEDNAFHVPSLQTLYFRQNHFRFNKGMHSTYNPRTLFTGCRELTSLDISNNYLPTVQQYNTFRDIFKPLTKLKYLNLARSSMRALPRDVFSRMKTLEILNLKENFLQGWEQSERVFGEKSSLKHLNLHSNTIRLVNYTTFPQRLWTSLETLDLSDNFYSCSCDLMWFRDWIRENIEMNKANLSLVGYPQYYKCKLPGDLRGLLLKQYNPTVENCTEKNPLIILAISIASVVVFAVIVIIVLYRCQTNIRNYIYLCRFYKNKKSGYIRLDSDAYYEYDAFIVYSDSDREWVHKICVKRLEDEGLKVCFHHRDFDIGESVTGNIDKYMNKCRKIVVVMSNNFAESEWCQWEVDLVQERRRRQGKDVTLLVMLQSIDSKHMTNRLRALLDTTPHLTYCVGVGEKVFWKALIKGLRKPFGHPPYAVL